MDSFVENGKLNLAQSFESTTGQFVGQASSYFDSSKPGPVVDLYRRSDDGQSERIRLHPSVFSVFSVFSVRSVVHFGMDAT
jgi:hypothetical protein